MAAIAKTAIMTANRGGRCAFDRRSGSWSAYPRAALSASDVRECFESQRLVLPLGPPEQLGAFVAEERKRWGDVIRRATIQFPR
jgi:tripartite-type tricarboxylate transporter receptor subunit TctC